VEPKAKPIPKRGERNIHCPFYNDCLDYAVKHSWQSWNCCQCPHKVMQSTTECEYDVNDTGPYYDLPPNVARRIRKNESDI